MNVRKLYTVVTTKSKVEKLAGTNVLFPWDQDFDFDPADVSAMIKFEYKGKPTEMWVQSGTASPTEVDSDEEVLWSIWAERGADALSLAIDLK